MSQEVMMEEAVQGMDQQEDRQEGAWVGGSAESDELEAKTQENPHPNPTSRYERRSELREIRLRCGIRYERWSGDTRRVWKIGRLAQMMIELYVMVMDEVSSQIRK